MFPRYVDVRNIKECGSDKSHNVPDDTSRWMNSLNCAI